MGTDRDASLRRMERLSRMGDFDVAPREPDPRGWTVVNREGRAVGEVKDLIVDTDRMAATYLVVELDTKLFGLRDHDPRVLVPVERAHRQGRRLVVEDIAPGWVSELRSARELQDREFWDRWWHRSEPGRGTPITRRVATEELSRALDDLRPGESVRIPVADEEIVVERRPITHETAVRDEAVVNRADAEPPYRQR
jgi:sporulation protein YlmC with PRC-barrel domain